MEQASRKTVVIAVATASTELLLVAPAAPLVAVAKGGCNLRPATAKCCLFIADVASQLPQKKCQRAFLGFQ